jgi:hypothetical protein
MNKFKTKKKQFFSLHPYFSLLFTSLTEKRSIGILLKRLIWLFKNRVETRVKKSN